MQRVIFGVMAVLATLALVMSAAWAGSPHFVGTCIATTSLDAAGQTIVTVSAKEAGLGDEAQIDVTLTVVAECVNNGGHNPNASNKDTFGTTATEPVQNGKADYSLSVTLAFSPSCSPPMEVVIDSISLVDTTNNLTCTITQ